MVIEKETGEDQQSAADEKLLELSALFEISRSLTSSLSIRSILENILRIPMGHLLITKGIVLIKKSGQNEYIVEELKGMNRNLKGKCIAITYPPEDVKIINEVKNSEEWAEFFREFGLSIVFPLNTSQGIIGIVGYGSKIGNKKFIDREIEFLSSLSNIAATAVANGLNVEELRKVNRNLDRRVQQLNTIFDISQEINTTLDQEKTGSIVSFAIMGELMVNKCAIFFRNTDKFSLVTAKGTSCDRLGSVIIPVISDPLFLSSVKDRNVLKELGFTLLVPMMLQGKTVGAIALGSKINNSEFSDNDIEFLKILGNQAAASLENVRLFTEALEKQRMEEELKLARSMQQGLLPAELPDDIFCEFAAINIPSREVGGDYYDVIRITDNIWGVAIADVSGKGAGAALLMANLQASLNVLAVEGTGDVSEIAGRINNLIFKNTALDKFITFFYGLINTENNTITFCNAGHNPPYKISKSGEITELTTGGIVLGMMENVLYKQETVSFNPGDKFVLYTDGVTEAMDELGEEFGEEKLKSIIFKSSDKNGTQLLNEIVSSVKDYEQGDVQADDITVVVVRRK
ncbi:SpoIIE family protein phosphatase [bacterium]|nr:SpoIIE family protein phosphatase [bacterium]